MRSYILLSVFLLIHLSHALAGEPAADALKDFGAEVQGLRTKVSLVKESVAAGLPVEIRYVKRNVSNAELKIWHSGFWPNHKIVVKDSTGREAALTAHGKQCRDAFNPGGGRDKNFPLMLKAGEEDSSEGSTDLGRLVDLSTPGKYTVEIIYAEKQGGWEGRVVSNAAAFEITR